MRIEESLGSIQQNVIIENFTSSMKSEDTLIQRSSFMVVVLSFQSRGGEVGVS